MFRAAVPLRKGDEITYSYCDTLAPLSARQKSLKGEALSLSPFPPSPPPPLCLPCSLN